MRARWGNFDSTLSAFSEMIDEQKNVLKQETDQRIKSLNNDLEKFYNRWESLKPKERNQLDREIAMETSEQMKDWRQQWDELETKTTNIMNDCKHFGIDAPHFSFYDELKNDLAKQETAWRTYDEFNEELNKMGVEDWISFSRGKGIYDF